jgi:NAD(P)H-dependent FMN reductase
LINILLYSSISATLGGVRAGIQLRSFIGALGMIAVPKQVSIGSAHEKVSPEGKVKDEAIIEAVNLLLQHVYWAARALKTYSAKTPPPAWTPS